MDISEPTDALGVGVGVGAVAALLAYVAELPTVFALGTGGFVAIVVASVLLGRVLEFE
ncbi:hypothetical protein [Halobaculum limi]|uniref:hypothetical protein n=1 Tax=Halobaculum limi TaxID=3031916 RepID=UPI002405D973|nr:hypothetical protein [Halobaculum sp. YSMS11]